MTISAICPKGYTCIDKANDGCDPNQGGADCIGVYVKTCGGKPGTLCSKPEMCKRAPGSKCNPNVDKGCLGVCLK